MSEASTEIQDEWARTFAREGYFIVERALEPDLLDGLRRDADTAIAEERESLQRGEERYVPVSQLDDRYVISGFVRRSEFVRRFVFGELAASICRAAIGGDAFLYSDTFVCMAPHNEHGWIWHQDSSYLDHVGCGHYPPNLGVWVALDDVTPERGPLRVLPFSQVDARKVVPHDLNKPWDSERGRRLRQPRGRSHHRPRRFDRRDGRRAAARQRDEPHGFAAARLSHPVLQAARSEGRQTRADGDPVPAGRCPAGADVGRDPAEALTLQAPRPDGWSPTHSSSTRSPIASHCDATSSTYVALATTTVRTSRRRASSGATTRWPVPGRNMPCLLG